MFNEFISAVFMMCYCASNSSADICVRLKLCVGVLSVHLCNLSCRMLQAWMRGLFPYVCVCELCICVCVCVCLQLWPLPSM